MDVTKLTGVYTHSNAYEGDTVGFDHIERLQFHENGTVTGAVDPELTARYPDYKTDGDQDRLDWADAPPVTFKGRCAMKPKSAMMMVKYTEYDPRTKRPYCVTKLEFDIDKGTAIGTWKDVNNDAYVVAGGHGPVCLQRLTDAEVAALRKRSPRPPLPVPSPAPSPLDQLKARLEGEVKARLQGGT